MTDETISASIEIYEREAKHWLLITGELFGPFNTQDEALDAIPGALRSMD